MQTKAAMRYIPDDEEWNQRLYVVLSPRLKRQMVKGIANAAAEQGIVLDMQALNPAVIDYIEKHARLTVKKINDTTREKLRTVISEAISSGNSDRQGITDAVQKVIGNAASQYRAEMIARTEIIRAQQHGRLEQFKESGAVRKVWVAGVDACEFCQAVDGHTVDIEENFFDKGTQLSVDGEDGKSSNLVLDYEDVVTQPLHPNCNCETAYEFDD